MDLEVILCPDEEDLYGGLDFVCSLVTNTADLDAADLENRSMPSMLRVKPMMSATAIQRITVIVMMLSFVV